MSVATEEELTELPKLEADQQPHYVNPPDDPGLTDRVIKDVRKAGGLVPWQECQALIADLARIYRGEAVGLWAGNCADTLDAQPTFYERLVKVLLQMVVIIMYGAGVPVVKVLRVCSWGKPRSQPTEVVEIDGRHQTLNVWRGEMVCDRKPTPEARVHDPRRMSTCHKAGQGIYDQIRRLTRGGMASLERIQEWNLDFVTSSPQGRRYARVVKAIGRALEFMQAAGVNIHEVPELQEAATYFSHEGLILQYENALLFGGWALSAHMLWIGERTRDLLKAHVEWFRRLKNPVGVKVSTKTTVEEMVQYCRILNPNNDEGKLVAICRMGAKGIGHAAILMEAAALIGCPVVWVCDPMHGNTFVAEGYKTRLMGDIKTEIAGFFAAVRKVRKKGYNVHPGGFMLELTGEDEVMECLGGDDDITAAQLHDDVYASACDPRLNGRQSLEIAFFVAMHLRRYHRQLRKEQLAKAA